VSHVVKVPLGSDEALLAQMRKGTRYDVRRAQRRGVTVERSGDDAARLAFYRLLQETSRRHGFPIRPRAYYDDVLRVFQDDAALLVARVDGAIAGGILALRFGDEAVYLSGASSTEHRGQDAGHYLQYEAMRWARERGCTRYNMWGVATESLRHFKVGFGGEVVASPPTLARRYRPVLAALAPRAITARYQARAWLNRRSGAWAE
jgi:lipid II:glycine glycyltransferase (peptidoglycan interpeptide bridge formation enzyme)